MTKIKICGMRSARDIEIVNEYLPDYAGFVFAPGKRQVNDQLADEMRKALNPLVLAVGVFVNEPLEHIEGLVRQGIIQLVQLHGDEDGSYLHRLKCQIDSPIIKAVRVQKREQILNAFCLPCDYLLLDAYEKGQYGGAGKRFSTELIPADMKKPWFLAGGLNPDNAAAAIEETAPWGVDVSSGVETEGIKNFDKIRDFITNVRQREIRE